MKKLLTFLLLFFILTLNAATFKDADLNRDGSLCIEEIRLSNLYDLEKRFKDIDVDENGLLSKQELLDSR